MNFLFRNLFFVFAFIFLALDGLFLFGDALISAEYTSVIAIVEILILSGLAYLTSIKPIHSLKKEIAFFLTGSKQ